MLDLNECSIDNGQCSSICSNTVGSYICSCDSGYALEDDGHNCTGKLHCCSSLTITLIQISMSVSLIMVDVVLPVQILQEGTHVTAALVTILIPLN